MLFAAVGVWAVIINLGNVPGLTISGLWLALVVWWCGFAYSYGVTLMADGTIRFRSLCRRRAISVYEITKIKKRGADVAEYGSWIVVRYRGGRVRMGDDDDEIEVIRRIGQMNPAVVVDPAIFDKAN
jgi:hypothetical protein